MQQHNLINYSFKELPDRIGVSMLLLGLVVFAVALAGRGLDITDQGFLLSLDQVWTESRYYPIWGSVYFSHLLNNFFGDWSLFVSRLFAALCPFFILLLFWWGYRKSTKVPKSALVVMGLLSVWAWRSTLAEWTYYSTLSGLVISLLIVFLDRATRSPQFSNLSAAGLALTCALLIKVTNLVFFGIFFIFLWELWNNQQRSWASIANALKYLLIPFAVIGSLLLFVSTEDLVRNYQEGLTKLLAYSAEQNSIHSPSRLFQKTGTDILNYALTSFYFLVFAGVIYFTCRFKGRAVVRIQAALMLLFFGLQYYFNWYEWNGLFFVYVLVLLGLYFNPVLKQQRFLIAAALYFLLFNSLGSGNGIKAAFIAEPLVCYVIVLCCFKLPLTAELKKTAYCCVLILMAIGVCNQLQFNYRDLPIWDLSTKVDSKFLSGIRTFDERASLINQLQAERAKLPASLDSALIYPSAPLLHRSLSLKPFFSTPWPNIDTVRQLSAELAQKRAKPAVVIRLKRNPRLKNWPLDPRPIEKDKDWVTIKFLDDYVASLGYATVYDSDLFTIQTLAVEPGS